jgi:hypothetical protein
MGVRRRQAGVAPGQLKEASGLPIGAGHFYSRSGISGAQGCGRL